MAKVKSAGLRNYVGRLGGSVYYMNKGQNIGRELAPEVSNPRTPAQMRQRMKWANLVNIYKANRSWMGHLSFETKKQTWSDYNAYMSANIGANPVYLTKGAAENGDAILAPYTMTKGSLPTIDYAFTASLGGLETSIKIVSDPVTSTVGELSQEILDNNPEWQYGDQLSIVLMYKGVAPYPIVVPVEIVINPSDDTLLSDIDTQFAPLSDIITIDDSNGLGVVMDAGVSFGNQACCVIHSRTISGRTYVSTQAFVLNVTAQIAFQQMGTDEQFEYAAASYGLGADFFLAAGYQDMEGGGGDTGLIRSFTGRYEDDYHDEPVTFTIVNGGRNTLRKWDKDGVTGSTPCTLVGRGTLVALQDYCLAFNEPGQQPQLVGQSITPSNNTLTFQISDTDAERIQRKAGTYSLYQSDVVEGTPVQVWNVLAD